MMVNLDPDASARNPRVLKAIAQQHQGQAGIYTNIVRPGTIRIGDAIRMVSMS
jgi:MOSC domain-containing protein YiiM